MQNIKDASNEVERSNSDRMQAEQEKDEEEERKALAEAKAKKNLSAKIGKNIAVSLQKKETQK